MKFTTFIKAYKLALSNIGSRTASWKGVYLGDVHFPENNNRLVFIFSSGPFMELGDIGMSATLNIDSVEKLDGGLNSIAKMTGDALDKDVMAREYLSKNEKINECGRIMVLLETLLDRFKTVEPDKWESADIESVFFNFDKDLAEFSVDGVKIYTNGSLVLFGD